jgi:mannose-6-phosphate isomerase-like protein (cupin superfamily)
MKVVRIADCQQFSGEKMKKNTLFETPRLFCDIYCFEPGQEQTGHVHAAQDKVYLVLSGQGTFQIGNETRVLGPGDCTLAPAGAEHAVRNHTHDRLSVLVFVAPNAREESPLARHSEGASH